MMQAKRISARAVLLAAGTAGFVALGAGVAGAETSDSPVHEIAPTIERALVEGVAPTLNSLAPQGAGPIAGTALSELQETSRAEKPAPDLAAPLPDGQQNVRTPLGDVPNPVPALADTVSGAQDATGLDGDPHHTIGHTTGEAVENRAVRAGDNVEDVAQETGSKVEEAAVVVLPHAVRTVHGLPRTLAVPQVDEVAQRADVPRLPQASGLTDLTGENTSALSEVADLENPLSVPESHTVPQSASRASGVTDLTTALLSGEGPSGEVEPLNVDGPLADYELPRLSGTGIAPVDDTLPQVAGALPTTASLPTVDEALPRVENTGLPAIAEGADTRTAEDLVAGLSRGTDLLNDLDTSNLVEIEGGTAEPQTPAGMTQHPTFMDLPGSEALPVVS